MINKDLHLSKQIGSILSKGREPATAGFQSRLESSKPAWRNQLCKRETREALKPYPKTVKRTSHQAQQMNKESTDCSVPLNNEGKTFDPLTMFPTKNAFEILLSNETFTNNDNTKKTNEQDRHET
ncbi:hypothetical protein V1478_005072 [Vespula squamosa]|uniref:Uncharacterized protein n=1 Tax=Vespula squamosa TaxID=30214 RepID=A0ABD2BD33_VESSQ